MRWRRCWRARTARRPSRIRIATAIRTKATGRQASKMPAIATGIENAMRLRASTNGHDRERREVGTDQDRERAGDARKRSKPARRCETSNRKHTIHAAVTGTSLIGWIDWMEEHRREREQQPRRSRRQCCRRAATPAAPVAITAIDRRQDHHRRRARHAGDGVRDRHQQRQARRIGWHLIAGSAPRRGPPAERRRQVRIVSSRSSCGQLVDMEQPAARPASRPR